MVIGVTGLPCAGKSFAARLLASGEVTGRPGELIQADLLGREVLEHPEVLEELRWRFGPEVTVAGNAAETRRRVAERVFRDEVDLAWLEGMIHPLVVEETARIMGRIDEHTPVFLEAALLLAAGMERQCDAILLVEAGFATRLARAAGRGWDREELKRRDRRLEPQFTPENVASWRGRLRRVANDADDGCLAQRLRTAMEGWSQDEKLV